MLGVSASTDIGGKKIIILSSEACGGEKIGIIVDDVHSVIQIHEDDAEHLGDSIQEPFRLHQGDPAGFRQGVDRKER